jgi:magnesium transporter
MNTPRGHFTPTESRLCPGLRCYVDSEASADEAGYRLQPVEVRLLIASGYLLTLHAEPLSLPAVLAPDLPPERSKHYVVYSVLDAMLTSTSDALEEVELRLDALSASWTDGGGGNASRATLQGAGTSLSTMRRWARAEEAVFERVGLEVDALDGFGTSDDGYFDGLDEQVSRLLASIDAASNAVGMLVDLQLNERAYVVSVIATIFVPLTFITGFFGMNFGWMVDQVDTPIAFWLLGFLIPIATAASAWWLLVRRFTADDR